MFCGDVQVEVLAMYGLEGCHTDHIACHVYNGASALEKSINHLYLEANVKDSRGNILVLSTASFLVLQER